MEDLDSLLEDLGKGKDTSSAKKQRPPSSRVDLNELEDLMQDLAAPNSKQTPAPTPAPIQASKVEIIESSPSFENISQNRDSVGVIKPLEHPSNGSSSNGAPSKADSVDDLDALMESLNASSRSSRRVSSRMEAPVFVEEPSPPPIIAPTEPAAPSPPPTTPEPVTSTSYGGGGGGDLDSLLTNLTDQMNNISNENPCARGVCSTCRNPILGELVQAMGKTYHPEHFTCGNCREPLGTRNYYEQNGVPHCEKCFQELFCAKCAHCSGPVLDRCITALGKKWHVEHFICTQCLKPFGTGSFFERDGRPYCEADFYALFAPKCAGCSEPIRGDCINALGSQWHPEHFACTYCQKSFNGGTFFEFGGKPYCEVHYHQQTGSLCAGCGKPITGRCVNALGKKWHPEHFVCAFCMNALAGGSFTEHNNKAYCKECHGKLFGQS